MARLLTTLAQALNPAPIELLQSAISIPIPPSQHRSQERAGLLRAEHRALDVQCVVTSRPIQRCKNIRVPKRERHDRSIRQYHIDKRSQMRRECFERDRRNKHCRAWDARRVLIEPFAGSLVVGRIYAYQMWSDRLYKWYSSADWHRSIWCCLTSQSCRVSPHAFLQSPLVAIQTARHCHLSCIDQH